MAEQTTEKDIPVEERQRVLFYPVEVKTGEWKEGLKDIFINYLYQTDMRLLNSEDRILHSYLKGCHSRAFKHRREEGDERAKGLDRICFGVEFFCRDGSGDNVPYDFHSELFRPDYIVTDLTREEVIRKYLEELKGNRDEIISSYRKMGWLVGEEVENSQIEIIAERGSE